MLIRDSNKLNANQVVSIVKRVTKILYSFSEDKFINQNDYCNSLNKINIKLASSINYIIIIIRVNI